ncbi:hypothetical protein P2318_19100 [Myxococcaceae bacterium GXIMD 01537]
MQPQVQAERAKRNVLLTLGATVLLAVGMGSLGIWWISSVAKQMGGPAATTAKQFVVALAEKDRARALQLADPYELPEAQLDTLAKDSARLLENRAWSVTYAHASRPGGEETVEVFLVPANSKNSKPSRAFIAVVAKVDEPDVWKVRRLVEVNAEDYTVRVSF